MSIQYADIIIDIVHGAVDRPFQYRVPPSLSGKLSLGERVKVPFGRGDALRDGYIIGFSDSPQVDPARLKEIREAGEGEATGAEQLIRLAAWMKESAGKMEEILNGEHISQS